MKNKRNIIDAALIFLVIGIMLIPAIQKQFKLFPEEKLGGAVVYAKDTTFTWHDWFTGDYELAKGNYINDNFGFRNWFVKLKNEIYYEAFGKLFANTVVEGKSGFLYELKYFVAHAGVDYIGDKAINERFEMVKLIQDSLAKHGVHLLIIFAPGKASYYPEYITPPYDTPSVRTNYFKSIEAAKKMGINYIDFNGWFMQLKPHAKYPLYPKTGIHWSIYAMHIAFDSITHYMEKLLNKKLATFKIYKVEMRDTLPYTEQDVAAGLNLLSDLPHFKMANPHIIWPDTEHSFRPRVLTIADSYWMCLYDLGLPRIVYSHNQFWYGNREVLDYDSNKNGDTKDIDIKSAIEKQDVVIIMATEANYGRLGYNFIEEVYSIYKYGPEKYAEMRKAIRKRKDIDEIRIYIKNDPDWFEKIKKQAINANIDLDSCLELNAVYIYGIQHKNDTVSKQEKK
jgi:hypothetical protein